MTCITINIPIESLGETLAVGNTTDGYNIVVSAGSVISGVTDVQIKAADFTKLQDGGGIDRIIVGTGYVSVENNTIEHVANPVGAQDAATKAYVDSQIGSNNSLSEILNNGNTTDGYDIVISVGDSITSAGTTVNISDGLTVDGYTLINDDLAVTGKLYVDGLIDPSGVVVTSQASVPGGNPDAGKVTLWTRSSDGCLAQTDSGGVEKTVGPQTLAQVLLSGNTSGSTNTIISTGSELQGETNLVLNSNAGYVSVNSMSSELARFSDSGTTVSSAAGYELTLVAGGLDTIKVNCDAMQATEALSLNLVGGAYVPLSGAVTNYSLGGFYYYDVVFDGSGYLWVTGNGAGNTNVYRVDPATGLVVATVGGIGTGSGYASVCYGGGYIWVVSGGNNNLYKIDPATQSIIDTFAGISNDPRDIQYGDDGFLWVANVGLFLVQKIDPATGLVADFVNTGSFNFGITYADGYVWVAASDILKIDPVTTSIIDTIVIPGGNTKGIMFDGTYLWTNSSSLLTKIDISSDTIVNQIGLPYVSLFITNAGSWIFATDYSNHSVTAIHPTAEVIESTIPAVGSGVVNRAVFDGVNSLWVANDNYLSKIELIAPQDQGQTNISTANGHASSGDIQIVCGSVDASVDANNISITAGANTTDGGSGGDVIISAGAGAIDGYVKLRDGTGANLIVIGGDYIALERTAIDSGSLANSTVPGFESADDYLQIWGETNVKVKVTAGAGYVEVQKTDPLLTIKNTGRKMGFEATISAALASHDVQGGDVMLQIAWLDNDTLSIQDEDSGIVATGATPFVTGALSGGQTWKATFNADHTVSLAFSDAATDRAVVSTYWARAIRTQEAP